MILISKHRFKYKLYKLVNYQLNKCYQATAYKTDINGCVGVFKQYSSDGQWWTYVISEKYNQLPCSYHTVISIVKRRQ